MRAKIPTSIAENAAMPDTFSRRSWWHRPRIRFSLRTLKIFVLLIGGTLGWIIYSAGVKRGAVAAIKVSGGNVW